MSTTESVPVAGDTITVLVLAYRAPDGGWGTLSPHVPGVHGHGDTLEEAVEDWQVAVAFAREEEWEIRDVDVVSDDHDAAVFTRIPA